MRIMGSDGSLFEMSILGYQFPKLQTEEYDSNWLRIRIHVVHPQGEWSSIDPSLLTYEVDALATWFADIVRGRSVATEMAFTEPNLSFQLLDHGRNAKSLRIYFELESRPTWARSEIVPSEDLWVEFLLSEVNLGDAAEALRPDLAQYPQRAGR